MGRDLTEEQYWSKGIKQSRMRINTAWFLTAIARPLGISLILFSALIFYLRWVENQETWILPVVSVLLLGLLVGLGFYLLRGKWESEAETASRLDDELSLHNQLTVAQQGAAPYPPVKDLPRLFKWKGMYFLPPLLIGLAAVALALFLPISRAVTEDKQIQEPLAWSQLEEELEELKEEEIVEETYIEEKEKELELLRAQEPEEWYDHSSLEATDHLVENFNEQKANLSEELDRAAQQLEELSSGKGNPGALKSAFNEFQEAMEGMENSEMKPNKELLEQLKEISPEGIKQLSAEDIDKLKERLDEASKELCEDCDGEGQGEGQGEGEGEGQGNGEGSGDGELQDGERLPEEGEGGYGNGGINDGPGHDKYLYGDTHERLGAEQEGGLETEDLSSFTPGDLLELKDAAPQANEDIKGVRMSGSSDKLGDGGNRVWKQALLPAEQEALKNYFNDRKDK